MIHVIKNARNGDIALLHDGGENRRQTVAALKIILPKNQEKGFQFVKVHDFLKYKRSK